MSEDFFTTNKASVDFLGEELVNFRKNFYAHVDLFTQIVLVEQLLQISIRAVEKDEYTYGHSNREYEIDDDKVEEPIIEVSLCCLNDH